MGLYLKGFDRIDLVTVDTVRCGPYTSFAEFWNEKSTKVSHYYSNLWQILRLVIKEKELRLEEEKRFYIDIFLAQLSESEKYLFYRYCIEFDKLKVIKFDIFDMSDIEKLGGNLYFPVEMKDF